MPRRVALVFLLFACAAKKAPPPKAPEPQVALPASCQVTKPQWCNPLDGTGCKLAAGETCDLAADGTFQCIPADGALPAGVASGDGVHLGATAAAGESCNGFKGPFCATGLTCLGTGTPEARCALFCCGSEECGGSECVPLATLADSRGGVGACVATPAPDRTALMGLHRGEIQGRGRIVAWTTWRDALAREMRWYDEVCPDHGGYPLMASATHYGADCGASGDADVIVATQDGTGILTYLKYAAYTGGTDPRWLATARAFGDYIVREARTPDEGVYPLVPRSTGKALAVPQPADCGRDEDLPYEIEPDKAGLAGFALVQLWRATGEASYLDAAVRTAKALAANQREGTAERSPFPFRVDYRDGTYREEVSSNMTFILRLYDELLKEGHSDLKPAREALWKWIRDVQIPDVDVNGALWMNFYENHSYPDNRNAWAPLHLARYLMAKQDALDPRWRELTEKLLGFVDGRFVVSYAGYPVCIEQDWDPKPFGGVMAAYGAAMADYAHVTGSLVHRARARQAFDLMVQIIGEDGLPNDLVLQNDRGGWHEDAHTDKVHNFLDAMAAFPEWAE